MEPRAAAEGCFSQTGLGSPHPRGPLGEGGLSMTQHTFCAKLYALPFTQSSAELCVVGASNLQFRDGGLSLSHIGKAAQVHLAMAIGG